MRGSASASFRSRRPQASPSQVRGLWNAVIANAAWLCGVVLATGDEPAADAERFGQTVTRTVVALRDLTAENFPVQADSARTMAAAFLALARAFCHPAWSPRSRTACAPFLAAGAAALERLMDELRATEAEQGRRVLGERDGD